MVCEEREKRQAAEAACAKFDDKSLSAILHYLAPADGAARARADALLKVRSLDALTSSNAAMDEESKRNQQYRTAVSTMVECLIDNLAAGQDDRVQLLEDAVASHLEKQSRKRARLGSLPAPRAPPVGTLLANIAQMWRNAKRVRDYVGARQALSLLVLPKRCSEWTHTDIINLVSEV